MKQKLLLILWTALVPASFVIILLAYLGSFTQLMADDFCSAYYAERLGIFRSTWYWYITWHGGYSAAIADGFLGLFAKKGIGFVFPIAILVWWVILILMHESILKYYGYDRSLLLLISLSAIVLCGTFILSPTIKPSLLWWGGFRGYIPPLVLFPLYICTYMHFLMRKARLFWNTTMWCVVSFLIVLVNSGFSETFTPVQLIILVFLLAWILFTSPQSAQIVPFLLSGIFGGFLGLVLMVVAPGNSARQAFFPAPPSLFEIMVISLRGAVYFLGTIFSDPAKIMMLTGIMITGLTIGAVIGRNRASNTKIAPFVFGSGLVFIYCCFPPAAYGQSAFPADHTLVIPAFLLVYSLFSTSLLVGQNLSAKFKNQGTLIFKSLYILMLLTFVFSSLAVSRAYILDIPSAVRYAEEWQSRDDLIVSIKLSGKQTVLVPSIKNWIGILEPINNPRFFVNSCMSLYYDVGVLSDKKDIFK
ncbi:MAG: DUF6056 family protein [Chloroflexi bacterium]|nr:DUF6056 family protein [Chloroflexota bacterium]